MKDRSCKTCKWIEEDKILVGEIYWCGANSEETKSGSYCINYRPKKK